MTAYYNEIDKGAAAWLEQLIKAGLIAPGVVDTRSIEDVNPNELTGYTQCHFFAGVGAWSYALRQAGWPDNQPVWTGSCPCQPYSQAGERKGNADERNLWPAFFHLISQRKPPVLLGEQVASKDALAWLDTVQADLENAGYACGPVDTCAAGFGAPNIRQRLWFAAERLSNSCGQRFQNSESEAIFRARGGEARRAIEQLSGASVIGVANAEISGSKKRQKEAGWQARNECFGLAGRLGNTNSNTAGRQSRTISAEKIGSCGRDRSDDAGASSSIVGLAHASSEHKSAAGNKERVKNIGRNGEADQTELPNPTNGFWSNPDWLSCRDDSFRPVEPGTFPLVDGAAARVVRLRGYGNAINAEAAKEFIAAFMAYLLVNQE